VCVAQLLLSAGAAFVLAISGLPGELYTVVYVLAAVTRLGGARPKQHTEGLCQESVLDPLDLRVLQARI
jgi:hypothetical protein